MRAPDIPRAVLSLIGFTAILAQIVLMRELMVVFYGNEISLGIILACWLLWTAFGSAVLGRFAARAPSPRGLLAVLQCFVGIAFPVTIFLVRASKGVFHPIPGEILGPAPMFLTSMVVLCAFCSASGMSFSAGSAAVARDLGSSATEATSYVYLLEAAGSGASGLLASLLLIRYLSAFEIALIVSLLNFVAAVWLLLRGRLRRGVVAVLIVVFALIVFPYAGKRLEWKSQLVLWRGFHVLELRNSIYGNLAVVKTEGAQSLFQNGLVVFTVPDQAAAEEAVHFALLEHPTPKSLLLIGGGVNGSLAQALQHSTLERVDYVELDPTIFALARNHFPNEWEAINSNPRVRAHAIDGRLFLKTTREIFDVIILNLPDPETSQLNRFYTLDFFREAAAHLSPNGVFSFEVRGAEDYISPELAEFLRCIRKTLSEAFPEVTFIPGSTFHFFAARQPGVLATSPEALQARLRARHLRTSYVREYYIPYRMMPDRMQDADLHTSPRSSTPVNRDFAPIAYYFDVAMWSGRFDQRYRRAFHSLAEVPFGWAVAGVGGILLALAALLGGFYRDGRRARSASGLSVAAAGFTLMGLEVLLLLGFQAAFGFVYYQLAILIAAFMAGMAAGSWWALGPSSEKVELSGRRGDLKILAALQCLLAISPVVLYALLVRFTELRSTFELLLVSQVIFPLLALVFGTLGGYQFPVASRVFFAGSEPGTRAAGTLYGLDLAGGCLGAVALSVYLVPVFGFFKTAIFIAVVNLAPAGLALLSALEKRPTPAA